MEELETRCSLVLRLVHDDPFTTFGQASRRLARAKKLITDCIKRLEEDQSALWISSEMKKCCEDKIEFMMAYKQSIEDAHNIFIAEKGRLELKEGDIDIDDSRKLVAMSDSMRAWATALDAVAAMRRHAFKKIYTKFVSWVTKHPLTTVGGAAVGAGAAGGAAAALVHWFGAHTGFSAAFPAFVAVCGGPLTAAFAAGAAAGAILGCLAVLLAHYATKRYDPKQEERQHRERLMKMVKELKELKMEDIVATKDFFLEVWKRASDETSPEADCIICHEPFANCDEPGHVHGTDCPHNNPEMLPTTAGGCTHHFAHKRCYQEWMQESRHFRCVVCHPRL